MPQMTELDMAKRIRQRHGGRDAGFDQLLVKPAYVERVLQALTAGTLGSANWRPRREGD